MGQGGLQARLRAHVKTFKRTESEQGHVFRSQGQLECSWVAERDWHRHQREELEGDLIDAHVLTHGMPPLGQFIG